MNTEKVNLPEEYKVLGLQPKQELLLLKVRGKVIQREKPTTQATLEQLLSDVISAKKMKITVNLLKKDLGSKVILTQTERRHNADTREVISFFLRGETLYNQAILYAVLNENDQKTLFLIEQIPLLNGLSDYHPKKKREVILLIHSHITNLLIKPIRQIIKMIGTIRNFQEYRSNLEIILNKSIERPVLQKLIRGICLMYKQREVTLVFNNQLSISDKRDLRTLYQEAMKIYYFFIYVDGQVTSKPQVNLAVKHAEKITVALTSYPKNVKAINQMSVDETNLFVNSLALIHMTPSGNAINEIRNYFQDTGRLLKNHFSNFQTRINTPFH